MVFRFVAAMTSLTFALSRVWARFKASATISYAAYLNPIGWVQGFLVLAVHSSHSCLAVLPESEDLKGWLGLHQISEVRPLGRFPPRASTADGKRMAFPMVAALGLKPCWWHCLQQVAQSGGIITPVIISTFSFFQVLMKAL